MNPERIWLAVSLLVQAQVSGAIVHSETHSITTSSPTTGWDVVDNISLHSLGFGNRRFAALTFTVSETGGYTISDTGGGTIEDTVVGIYSSAFNVSDLSVGWLAGDDDSGGLAGPFSADVLLTAGQTYTVVTSPSFPVDSGDPLGDIIWQVDGPDGATLTPVPEPENVAIVSTVSLLAIAAWRRGALRKRTAH